MSEESDAGNSEMDESSAVVSEAEERDPAELEQLRNNVLDYLTLPEKIKEGEEPLKQLKQRKKELQQSIQVDMGRRNYNTLAIPPTLGGGVLMIKETKTKAPLKKEHWEKAFDDFCSKRKIEATFDEFEQSVNDLREQTTKRELKRKNPKNTKKSKKE